MRKRLVVHSFLFAVFPVLALYASNMRDVLLSELVIPLVVALGSAPQLWEDDVRFATSPPY